MKKKYIMYTLALIFGAIIFTNVTKDSYANIEENQLNLELFQSENQDIFKDNIKNYIDLLDNYIIPTSSFNLSDKLNENYDFLTKFVISLINDNQEYFNIIEGSNYTYSNELGETYTTNKFIDINLLYEITNKIFGIDYYYILDEKLIVNNNLITLLPYDLNEFSMKITDIKSINKINNQYHITVTYQDSDLLYIYQFDIINNDRLVLSNLSVGE